MTSDADVAAAADRIVRATLCSGPPMDDWREIGARIEELRSGGLVIQEAMRIACTEYAASVIAGLGWAAPPTEPTP